MSDIATLIRGVLVRAEERGVRFAKRSTIDSTTLGRIADLTHAHAWNHGTEESDVPGWRRFPGGILPWWAEAAALNSEEKRRLHKFRSDVVRLLEDEGRARRDHPQSNHLHVAPPSNR